MPYEPTDLEIAMMERVSQGFCPFGPLTQAEAEDQTAYEAYCLESEAEHEATLAAGGRTICDHCGQRSVEHQAVCTLGYPGHPGAEFSDYGRCENCGATELAG